MAKTYVFLDSAGIQEILKSQAVQDEILKRARQIASHASAGISGMSAATDEKHGFEADVRVGKYRARAMVKPTSALTQQIAQRQNTLLKSIDAGR